MPIAAPRPCRHAGCRELVTGRDGFCGVHKTESRKLFDSRRGSSTQRGYGSRWQKARITFLRSHPLCAECERNGRVILATVVDHIVPHKGDQQLFWAHDNWQPLCKPCHDRKTATQDSDFTGREGVSKL